MIKLSNILPEIRVERSKLLYITKKFREYYKALIHLHEADKFFKADLDQCISEDYPAWFRILCDDLQIKNSIPYNSVVNYLIQEKQVDNEEDAKELIKELIQGGYVNLR